jgi:hypothetical protein
MQVRPPASGAQATAGKCDTWGKLSHTKQLQAKQVQSQQNGSREQQPAGLYPGTVAVLAWQ